MADQLFRLIALLDSHFAADDQLPADAVRWREFSRSVKDALDLVQTTLRQEREQGVPLAADTARKLEGLCALRSQTKRGVAPLKHESKLSAGPDGFGFFYGWVEHNGERVRVDVLPPDHLWRGDIKLKGQKPDPKAWVLYLDGEEFARVERREDIITVLGIEGPPEPRGLLSRLRALWRLWRWMLGGRLT